MLLFVAPAIAKDFNNHNNAAQFINKELHNWTDYDVGNFILKYGVRNLHAHGYSPIIASEPSNYFIFVSN